MRVRRWARPTPRSRQGPRLRALPGRLPSPDARSRGPATDRRALPPWTGFRRSFADPTRLSRGSGARPSLPWRSSRPGALDHASSVDFCHRIDPQARPADLRYPSWVWTPGLRRAPTSRSVRGFLSAHPRFTGAVRRPRSRVSLGQGPFGGAALALGSRRPLAAMARVRGFAPTQSTRTPLVARPTHGQAGVA